MPAVAPVAVAESNLDSTPIVFSPKSVPRMGINGFERPGTEMTKKILFSLFLSEQCFTFFKGRLVLLAALEAGIKFSNFFFCLTLIEEK